MTRARSTASSPAEVKEVFLARRDCAGGPHAVLRDCRAPAAADVSRSVTHDPASPVLARMRRWSCHVHLRDRSRRRAPLALARRRGIDLPADSLAGLAEWFAPRLRHFSRSTSPSPACLRDPRLSGAGRAFAAEQAGRKRGLQRGPLHSHPPFTARAPASGATRSPRRWSTPTPARGAVRLIPDWWQTWRASVADARSSGRSGCRAGEWWRWGSPASRSLTQTDVSRAFRVAAAAGLHRVAHAGEHAGPDSVRSVLEVCGAERVGHGVRAVEDPRAGGPSSPPPGCRGDLLAPTSAGAWCPTWRATPSSRCARRASSRTVNSDDPPLSPPP